MVLLFTFSVYPFYLVKGRIFFGINGIIFILITIRWMYWRGIMKIVIAGGSGFIGQKLTNLLLAEGHTIVILTRKEKKSSAKVQYVKWLSEGASPENEIKNVDAFINL